MRRLRCVPAEGGERTGRPVPLRRTAEQLAERGGARTLPRGPGSLTIPYLLRPTDWAEWDNYKVGDEVQRIEADDWRTTIQLASGALGEQRAPRIAATMFTWSKDSP